PHTGSRTTTSNRFTNAFSKEMSGMPSTNPGRDIRHGPQGHSTSRPNSSTAHAYLMVQDG
ncbi:MAG: hypothetical protein N3A02_07710, partial [Rectinema sp.]|nr:hypothetical protein [Rectinema sp.]